MNNALKSLTKIKFLAFLIILQLSFGLSMLNSTTALIQENNTKKENFDRLFNFQKTYMIRILPENFDQIDYRDSIFSNYNKINEFYSKFEDFKKRGIIDSYSILFPALFPIQDIDKVVPQEFRAHNEKTMIHRSRILVNEDFINRKDIKIVQGRELNSDDFKEVNTIIPILIGNGYKDKIAVGTTVNTSVLTLDEEEKPKSENFELKVVGIMEHNSIPSIVTKSNYMENIVYSDYSIVLPSIKSIFDLSPGVAIGDQGVYIETNNIEVFERVITPELEKIGMKPRIQSLKEDYEGIMEELTKKVMNSVTLGTTLTFLSVIGITAVLLGELRRRKREFGIRLASGATIQGLCKEIIYEIMFMMIFSSILSLIITWISTIGKDNFMSPYLLLVNIGVISVLTFIVSIIPVLRLRKMNVIELVRGK